ncbi:MAG TPA: hypothetical protein PLB01_02455 [Thermoanaerobaculia bacterium]|nr:hypothetical protein [Thermoanaerobaculia bacterium]
MKRNLTALALLAALAALPVLAQQGSPAGRGPGSGTAAAARIDVTKPSTVIGDVVSLKGGPGLGMPTLAVKVGGKEEAYVLGSYRYLTAQKFAPAAGDAVRLTLYTCVECPQGFVVAEVENLTQKTVLKLRNADGTPVFAGRMGGAGHGRGAGGACCDGNGAQAGPMDGTGPNPACPKKS